MHPETTPRTSLIGLLICAALGAFLGLVLFTDCGPDGDGQQACIDSGFGLFTR